MAIFNIEGVSKRFFNPRTNHEVTALEDISVQINDGEFFCLLGPSGCGKTTLLRIFAGLESPSQGRLLMDDELVNGPSWERGLIFQDYVLFPWRNVRKNVEFGLEARGIEKEIRKKTANEYINLVGLAGFELAYPSELSGGMQQRVGLARVLANESKVLLMDEPFGSLDAQTREVMQFELLRIWDTAKKTIVFVTHDIEEALFLSDRIAVMSPRPGRIKELLTCDMKRPRERDSDDFLKALRNIKQLLQHY
jgi:NitT/TauT family transport system ATP-binding protein